MCGSRFVCVILIMVRYVCVKGIFVPFKTASDDSYHFVAAFARNLAINASVGTVSVRSASCIAKYKPSSSRACSSVTLTLLIPAALHKATKALIKPRLLVSIVIVMRIGLRYYLGLISFTLQLHHKDTCFFFI